MVSLVGQNGTGKSTLMLLSGGRIFPDQGVVKLLGQDTRSIEGEEERNRLASFIYQNMEFETEDSVGSVMEFVYKNGFRDSGEESVFDQVIEVFELSDSLDRPLQNLAKGEVQRTILAFSLLYGSKMIIMDEPIFALEEAQKLRAMDFLKSYAERFAVTIYYSLHEIELSIKYSDYTVLFYKSGKVLLDETASALTDQNIEEAYELPRSMLYQKEILFREMLLERAGLPSSREKPSSGTN